MNPVRIALIVGLAGSVAACGIFRGDGKPKTPTIGERVAILNFESSVEAEPELAGLAVSLPPPAVNADWPQPGGSPAKAGGHLALPDTLSQAWRVSIGAGSKKTRRLNAAPVILNGRVFIMDTMGAVRAFDAKTGAAAWTRTIEVEGESEAAAFGGGVAAQDGRVYATTGYGVVAALDAGTGAEVWRVRPGPPFRGAPTVVPGRIYALTQDNQLFALGTDKGETLWSIAATVETAGLLGTGAPAVAGDAVVVGFSSGELNAVRPENGRTLWQDALARTGRTTALAALTDIDASPVIDRGRVYAIGHGGRMAALELATGQRVWERNFAGTQTPWTAGDFIYAVTLDGELVCMTRGDGKIRWVTKLPRWRDAEDKKGPIEWTGPVLASDRLLVAGSNKQLVSVSPYTGKLLSAVELSAPAYLPPVVAGNMVYIVTDDGSLTAYR